MNTSGIAANAAVTCYENGVAFFSYRQAGTSSAVCYYGYSGQNVSVGVNGMMSNAIRW